MADTNGASNDGAGESGGHLVDGIPGLLIEGIVYIALEWAEYQIENLTWLPVKLRKSLARLVSEIGRPLLELLVL